MFNKRTKIKELLESEKSDYSATVMGWVRTFRNNQFIALNDGSTIQNLQVVVLLGTLEESVLKRISTGACIKASGTIVPSLGKGVAPLLSWNRARGGSDTSMLILNPNSSIRLLMTTCWYW